MVRLRGRVSEIPQFRLHHGALSVRDLQRSLEFYEEVLGFKEASRVVAPEVSLEIVFIKKGNDYIELLCHKQAKALPDFCKDSLTDFQTIGTKHIAFEAEDATALHKHLQAQGAHGLSAIFTNNPTYYYFFFRDPDGILLEVVSPK